MIKIIIFFIFIITNLTALENEKIYTVAFLKNWQPYYKTDANKKPDGYVYEVFEAIAKESKLKFKYKIVENWKELFALVEKGQIDIVPNIGITKKREHLFLFAQPTDTMKLKLFKRENSTYIKSIKDIKDLQVGVMDTNVCNKLITKDITNKKVVLDNFSRLFTSLTSGEVDTICYPETLMNERIKELGLESKIVPFDDSLKEIKRGLAVSKINFQLLPLLNDSISKIKINGEFQKIYNAWFSKKEAKTISEETFNKVLISIVVLLFILLFVLYLNNKLKQESAKQNELEKKLEAAQKIAKLGHYNYSFKDTSFSCSSEIIDFFGLDDAKKYAETWVSCIHTKDRKRVHEDWNYAINNHKDFHSEYRIINLKTKQEIWVVAIGEIIRDTMAQPVSMFGTVQDINERKKLELKLNQAMMVFENTHDGIMITDRYKNIVNVNKSFETTTGYKFEEVINKNPSILKSDYNKSKFYKEMWSEIDTKGVWSGEIVNKKKNSDIYHELLTINAIKDINNDITGYVGIFSDITQRKNDEKIIFTQSKVAAVGEMLGNISHQWRQPLSVISTHATGIKASILFEDDDLNNDKILISMDKINEQSQYLSKTIDDFRSFFTGDINTANTFNIQDTFEKLEKLTRDVLKNNYIEYKSSILSVSITKNENLLIQALINIINNAKDAIVEHEKDSDKRLLLVDTKIVDDNLEISIKDTGGGIALSVIDKIFEPYFTTKHQSIGTGIGLYMTYQIINKQFEGTIKVSNIKIEHNKEELRGAEFKLILPLTEI